MYLYVYILKLCIKKLVCRLPSMVDTNPTSI